MMDRAERFSRTERLLGSDNMERIRNARVAIFGIGGVGGHVVEALARCGVGALDLIDADDVAESNCNRQMVALGSTIGRPKVEVAKERILDVNPECQVTTHRIFYLPDTAENFDFSRYDYVVDAIDTVSGKLMLAEQAFRASVPIISAMGAGNKLDPTAFRVADIYDTKVCPLAKVMRRELKRRGIDHLKVVYSEEEPLRPLGEDRELASGKHQTPGSVAFVPSVVGLILAGEVIKDLCKFENRGREK